MLDHGKEFTFDKIAMESHCRVSSRERHDQIYTFKNISLVAGWRFSPGAERPVSRLCQLPSREMRKVHNKI